MRYYFTLLQSCNETLRWEPKNVGGTEIEVRILVYSGGISTTTIQHLFLCLFKNWPPGLERRLGGKEHLLLFQRPGV